MEQLVPNRGTWDSRVWIHQNAHCHRYEQITWQDSLWHGACITNCMNHETLMNNQFESTYALLVRSQEKGRGLLEAMLYVAFILSAVLVIWEFAQSPISIQAVGLERGTASQSARTQVIAQS